MLASKMLALDRNCFLIHTAVMTRMFRKVVVGEAMDKMIDVVRNVVVSLKIHVNLGLYGH